MVAVKNFYLPFPLIKKQKDILCKVGYLPSLSLIVLMIQMSNCDMLYIYTHIRDKFLLISFNRTNVF